MSDGTCSHKTLKRQNVGDFHWYKCVDCPERFLAKPWDGKVAVHYPATAAPAEGEKP